MKKWIFLWLIALMCVVCVISVSAAESDTLPDGYFATSADLFGYWESTYPPQYPDYICGVWTDNGTTYPLTFSVTNDAAGRAGKKEILRLLADDSSVKFTTGKYSRNLLMQVMEDISQYFDQDLGLVGLGVYDIQNHVGLDILQSYADHAETKQWLKDLKARYGDAIFVRYTGGYVTDSIDLPLTYTGGIEGKADASAKMIFLCCFVGAGLLGTTAVFMVAHRKKSAVAQTNAGTVTVSADRKLTCREVETAIKNSEAEPSSDLEEKIRSQLNK